MGIKQCQLDELMSFKNYYYTELTTQRTKIKNEKKLID